jgi:hypothetical protein
MSDSFRRGHFPTTADEGFFNFYYAFERLHIRLGYGLAKHM